MQPLLKLNDIDREHLQDLYDAAGFHRDLLPYTPEYDALCEGFDDRTFKGASPEQVFVAIVKCVRTGSSTVTLPETPYTPEQIKAVKALAARYAKGGKLIPYSKEFESARTDSASALQAKPDERAFWVAVLHAVGTRRPPPARKKAVKVDESDDD